VAAAPERRDRFNTGFVSMTAATYAAANGDCVAGFQHGEKRLAALDILEPLGKVLLEHMRVVAANPYDARSIG
jgi:hypothetical protein